MQKSRYKVSLSRRGGFVNERFAPFVPKQHGKGENELEKEKTAGSDFESEILRLKIVCEKQYTLLEKYTDKITEVLKETYLN